MSDPNNPDWSDPTQADYPPNPDPAYAGQYWGQQGTGYYGTPTGAPMTGPTQQLPPYWQTAGYAPNQAPPPPPQPPKSPRWLWIAAGAAVLLAELVARPPALDEGLLRQLLGDAATHQDRDLPRLSEPLLDIPGGRHCRMTDRSLLFHQ